MKQKIVMSLSIFATMFAAALAADLWTNPGLHEAEVHPERALLLEARPLETNVWLSPREYIQRLPDS
ncbi:hypothetical protein [Salsuginibacillus halophilus]|uniref:hypothetical protein n=1 Tax=Salsuginibacillus halophilus TaxID=517424 RepID=UPI000D0E1816|nr:hypothetical protein [Salsuginibacillus halophilus]